jgi:subtilase family serine protease
VGVVLGLWGQLARNLKEVISLAGGLLVGFSAVGFLMPIGAASAQTVPLRDQVAPQIRGLVPTSEANPNQVLRLEIRFALRNRGELDALLQALQTPSSLRYHKWLNASDFAQRFGPRQSDFDAVADWLRSNGFEILGGSKDERAIRFRGPVVKIEKSFKTKIFRFGAGAKFGNLAAPEIPTRFAGTIGAIVGLDNFAVLEPLVRTSPLPASASVLPLYGGGSLGDHFAPSDFYTFYNETPLSQAGVDGGGPANDCIGIFAESNTHADVIDTFNSTFGLPPENLSMVFVEQSDPGYQPGAETELLLDTEWSHAIAPAAPTVVYVGDFTEFPYQTTLADGIGAFVRDNKCGALDISYHICNVLDSYYSQVLDPLFAQAAAQGQSVFVSSGDTGGNDCGLTTLNVSEMAADPNVVAVGGTQFAPIYDSNGNDVGSNTEYAWDDPTDALDPGGATGGGASRIFTKPYWQSGPSVPNDGVRDLPDVAMMAGIFQPGTFIIDDQGGGDFPVLEFVGGTSVGAPIWAGISKLIMQLTSGRLGNMNPKIYAMARQGESAEGLRDVTGNSPVTSDNRFPAGAGYDQATGWGTVDLDKFVNHFAVEPPPATPTATPTSTASTGPTATATPTPTPTSTATPIATKLEFQPTVLKFGKISVGRSSEPKKVTLTNRSSKGSADVNLAGLQVSSDFSMFQSKTTCGSSVRFLAVGRSCVIELVFAPTTTGPLKGTLVVSDSAGGSPPTLELRGAGK